VKIRNLPGFNKQIWSFRSSSGRQECVVPYKGWIAFLCTGIRPSIGTENLIPEEVNYTKITIRVTVMNKMQFLMVSEPRKPL
jgi:hypothetical protein